MLALEGNVVSIYCNFIYPLVYFTSRYLLYSTCMQRCLHDVSAVCINIDFKVKSGK